jgi:uncharacterized protein (DUF305 family)
MQAVGDRPRACEPPAQGIRNRAVRGHGEIWCLIRRALFGLALASCALALVDTAACSSTSPGDTSFMARSDAAMTHMMAAMRITPSGDTDRDFVAVMVPHHQGAVAMAQAELRYGHNNMLRRLAQEIIVTQQEEIAEMQLALAGADASSSSGADDATFVARCDRAMTRMMASMQISPSGDPDRDFVAMMVPHHQGAIDMAEAELLYGHNESLLGLAQEIIASQEQQIAVMRHALDEPVTSSVRPFHQPTAAGEHLLASAWRRRQSSGTKGGAT